MTAQAPFSSVLRFCLAVTLCGVGVFASSACSQEPDPECKAKFVQMLEPCMPTCQEQDPNGVGTDDCIRTCVQDEWGEPIPKC